MIRGNQLISNVINLSKIDNSRNSLQEIDILHVLKTSINYIESSFQESNLKIELNDSVGEYPSYKGLYVQGDKLIRNVFENIIFNAIYHNKNPTKEIFIKISRERLNNNYFVKVKFIDNGIGISDARKKTIFQKENEIQEKKKGRGFGLTLVKKLIKKYHGYIWVEDNVKGQYNKGSNFIIMIPEICEKPYILT